MEIPARLADFDWLVFVYKASALRGGLGPTPGSEILPYIYNSNNPETKTVIAWIDTAPHGVETPTLLVADWLRLVEPARGESCPSGQRRGPDAPGEDKVHPRIRNPAISFYNCNNPGTNKADISRVDTTRQIEETVTPLAD